MRLQLDKIVNSLLEHGAVTATHYESPKLTIKATRKRFNGKFPAKNQATRLIVTIGRPNFRERKFIKDCLKAKEPFPIKKIQFRFPKK